MAYLWQISIVLFKGKTFGQGTVLKGSPMSTDRRSTFHQVFGSYFKRPLVRESLTFNFGNFTHSTITDDHGRFVFNLDNEVSEDFSIFLGDQELKIVQSYPVIFNCSDSPIAVISDIDDTILVSHTASLWKRVGTMLFTSPAKRRSVSFTKTILDFVNEKKGRIFFVSKSESNLFGMITSFILKHKIPLGTLFLTPYLRYNQLLNPKKGIDFKELSIRSILNDSHGQKFVLIGDDTQNDMVVYGKIAAQFPDRIVKVYIRKTRKNLLGNKKEQLNKLHNLAVPYLYFDDNDMVKDELQTIDELIK